jgi:hypothetical protein
MEWIFGTRPGRGLLLCYVLLSGLALCGVAAIAGDYYVRQSPVSAPAEAPQSAALPDASHLDASSEKDSAEIANTGVKFPATATIPEISIQRAAEAGFLPVMYWVCKAKQVPCETLLALAQLETSTGVQETGDSSAQGLWQITDGQFIARALKYASRDRSTIEAYLQSLNPAGNEAVHTRHAYLALLRGLEAARDKRYGGTMQKAFTKRVNDEILQARVGNLPIPALFVVDCLQDDLKYLARKTGTQAGDIFKYTYLAHVYGGPAAARILGAYKDAGTINQPIAPVLIAHYAPRYQKGDYLRPAERKQTENFVRDLLVNNGHKPNVSVRNFVDGYTEKYLILAQGIRGKIETASRLNGKLIY